MFDADQCEQMHHFSFPYMLSFVTDLCGLIPCICFFSLPLYQSVRTDNLFSMIFQAQLSEVNVDT